MTAPSLIAALLLTITFALATQLSLWRERSSQAKKDSGSVLEMLMGDSRRLFANHFVTKADVYLHSGVYPSMFDQAQLDKKSQLAAAAESSHKHGTGGSGPEATSTSPHTDADSDVDEHEEHDIVTGFLGKPRDWIEAFGRNFLPTKHVHLEQKADQREILPWLRLAADLNPNQADLYPLAAYWLRQRMGKVNEAEQFLREGWRANPNSFEILFELGRLFEENRKDDIRARNLFEAALRLWERSQRGTETPDDFAYMQITGHLARLEERCGNLDKAIGYLELLRQVSPSPDSIQLQIDNLKAQSSGDPTGWLSDWSQLPAVP